MINIAALALLLSSLTAAGVWSPSPPNPNPSSTSDPPLIREGHRVIVVEYERQIPSASQESNNKLHESPFSHLPNLGQGLSTPESDDVEQLSTPPLPQPSTHSAKDLVCDAYGSCKEKITHVFHRGKDKVSRKASDIEETAKDKAREIHESAKDTAKSKIEGAKEKAREMIQESVKDAAKSKIEGAKEKAIEIQEKMAKIEENIKDTAEGMEKDVSASITHAVENAKETTNSLHQNLNSMMSRARDVASNAIKYVAEPRTARAVAEIAHLLGFIMAYGAGVWVTFVSSHVLAMALPRQQFGMVQSKIYPVYFRVVGYGLATGSLGQFFAKERVVGMERVQVFNLMAALGLVLVNMFYLEPKATKVMLEFMKMEKEEGRGRDMEDVLGEAPVVASAMTTTTTQSPTMVGVTRTRTSSTMVDQDMVKSRVAKLNKKLKKLNKHSSFVNILSLMSMTWHLVHLARRLQVTC